MHNNVEAFITDVTLLRSAQFVSCKSLKELIYVAIYNELLMKYILIEKTVGRY